MRGAGGARRRRLGAWALVAVLAALFVASFAALPAAPARADITSVPGTMSTAAQNTSTFAVPVPTGVEARAITGVVTMPEVVEGGTITFRINGAVRQTVPSALYQKVRIPVDPADVIADGTIGLTMSTEGPLQPGATCVPTGGEASMRKMELDYRGAEVAPTSVADFFPATSAGITVVIPEDAGADMITAGLTAVAALAYRYADAPINLSLTVPAAETASASQRVVALVAGKPGEVTTAVATTSGIPMLTLTGAGDALVAAARALSTDVLALSGSNAQDLSQEVKPRDTAKTRTLEDLGIDTLALTGYGSVTQQFDLRQDDFGVPVSSLDLHLEGSHTAFSAASGARLDVRVNGDLVGSAVLGEEATFALDVQVPNTKLRSVNDVEVSLNAVAPDGSACTPPSIPPAEVDLDSGSSTATVTHGTGQAQGFQLFPQIYEGILPVALRSPAGRQASAAINAAAVIAALQRAGGSPLQIQLMEPDAFLADDRSGLIVGALAADSEALDAPLKLSSTRLLDREDGVVELTSQDPYAALESIDRNDRLVLMLGSWAPDNKAAPGELARKVVDAVVNAGWGNLDGDLVIADAAHPTFVTASRSLAPHLVVKKERSYVKLFVIALALLLLVLAIQVVMTVRRDRRLSRERDDDFEDDGPAYVEDDGPDYEVDALGDVDDLGVNEYAAEPEVPEEEATEDGLADEDADEFEFTEEDAELDDFDDTGEIPMIDAEEYDEDDEEPELEPGLELGLVPQAEPVPDETELGTEPDENESESESEEADEDDWDDWEDWGDESDEIGLDLAGPDPGTSPADETPDETPEEALEAEDESAIEDEGLEPTEEPEPEPEPDPPTRPVRRRNRRRRQP
ncbi:MAG: hypothetical protein QOD98_2897 [Nocardioidaceae bacterium]|nr:hypothetical protein [Nocardioidaceae bacterium]